MMFYATDADVAQLERDVEAASGDEFAIVLPRADLAATQRVAERVRTADAALCEAKRRNPIRPR